MLARRHPVLLGILIAFSALALWLSAVQISRMVRFGALPRMAYLLESGHIADKTSLDALLPAVEELRSTGICQSMFVKSGLTVLLASLSLEDQDADYNGWAAGVERAEAFARYTLGCMPTNGSVWLRLAMLRQVVSEQPREILELMRHSQAYAPAEAQVLAGRYALYNRLTASTLEQLSGIVTTDLQIVCSKSGDVVRDKLAAPSSAVLRIVRTRVPSCVMRPFQAETQALSP